MILLIYLLFLKVAAVVLYVFPYSPDAFDLGSESSILTVNAPSEAIIYLSWLAVDIGVVSLFAIAALHWPIWKCYLSRDGHGNHQKTLIEFMLPHGNIDFTISEKANRSTVWWFFVFLCLLPSVPFSYFSINNALSDNPIINV